MNNNQGLVCFGLGCAVGTVAALLLTSKSGRETMKYLRGKVDEGTKNVKQRVDDLSDAVTNPVVRGIKAVRDQTENLGAAVEAGKQAYRVAQEATP